MQSGISSRNICWKLRQGCFKKFTAFRRSEFLESQVYATFDWKWSLFGFGIDGVDYEAEVNPVADIDALITA